MFEHLTARPSERLPLPGGWADVRPIMSEAARIAEHEVPTVEDATVLRIALAVEAWSWNLPITSEGAAALDVLDFALLVAALESLYGPVRASDWQILEAVGLRAFVEQHIEALARRSEEFLASMRARIDLAPAGLQHLRLQRNEYADSLLVDMPRDVPAFAGAVIRLHAEAVRAATYAEGVDR